MGSRTLLVARRVARQLIRDRRSLGLLIVVPTLVVLLLGFVLRGGTGEIVLLVADENGVLDASRLAAARFVVESSGIKDLRLEEAESDEGVDRVVDGSADAILIFDRAESPRLVLEGTRPAISEVLTRITPLIAASYATQPSDRSIPGSPQIERQFIRAGPELDLVDGLAPAFIAFFAYFFVFLLTSVSFLRERSQGTLERLMVTPIRRREIIAGYMLGLGAFALLQAFTVVIVAMLALDLDFYGNLGWVFLTIALLTIGAVNLGILSSTFARNEFQAVQFMPMIIVPQVLLSEAFFTLGGMPGWVQSLSKIFPLTHAVAVVKEVMVAGRGITDAPVWQGMLILVAFALAFLVAGAYSLRKKAL